MSDSQISSRLSCDRVVLRPFGLGGRWSVAGTIREEDEDSAHDTNAGTFTVRELTYAQLNVRRTADKEKLLSSLRVSTLTKPTAEISLNKRLDKASC
jgi:hypothetical protein